ncbi:hypothetical protein FA13DRAFT_6175 [Coprinellus micaceus]|uniref:Uncharacterized protein n=1 Tax=Coprinellus micaceus TaxID=71717 RepID=A0A4Y7U153_COPMI|nr:hypothetical protein FA13DRAFT_6175 [Coprinellus micaceus]
MDMTASTTHGSGPVNHSDCESTVASAHCTMRSANIPPQAGTPSDIREHTYFPAGASTSPPPLLPVIPSRCFDSCPALVRPFKNSTFM